MSSPKNPYDVPTVSDEVPLPNQAEEFTGRKIAIQVAWVFAVAINLPVPLMLGLPLTQYGLATAGLMIGIVLTYVAGAVCCVVIPAWMWRLIAGSVPTAISQFWPALHIFVGMIAVGLSRAVFDPDRTTDPIRRIPEACCTTLLTGIQLIFVSLVIGATTFLVFRIRRFDRAHSTVLEPE